MLLIRSLTFTVFMYAFMAVWGIGMAPYAMLSRDRCYWVMKAYVKVTFWVLKHLCGLTVETRGEPPTGNILIAAKHQSFLDIMHLFLVLPRAKFVMKKSVAWAPVLGLYALRIGASPVTRGKGKQSLDEMMKGVGANMKTGGQLVIYPQGTRTIPRIRSPFKKGAHLIYRTYDMDCAPVAVNHGHFWGRNSVLRHPGVAVAEFLPVIPAGLDLPSFMMAIEQTIEPASDKLADEAEARFGL